MGNCNDSNNDNKNMISFTSKINHVEVEQQLLNLKYYGNVLGGRSKAKIKTYKSIKIRGAASKLANRVLLTFL